MTPSRRAMAAAALAALCLCVGLFGCTTSRAVLAWEAGWRAEAKGEYDTARRRYADAYERNDRLVGAELNRIRLLALAPDKRKEAQEDLDELLSKNGQVPEVAIFGAAWALAAGDAKRARERLKPVRAAVLTGATVGKVAEGVKIAKVAKIAKVDKGCRTTVRQFLRLDLRIEVALAHWPAARKRVQQLSARCGVAAVPELCAALVAYNTGDVAGATTWLARLPEGASGAELLRATLALRRGDHVGAAALLKTVEEPQLRAEVAILSAHAALARGDHPGAERLAQEALELAPAAMAPQLLLGVALLRRGEAPRARDLLAGAAARSKGTPPWTLNFDLGLAELRLLQFDKARSAFAAAALACEKGPCEVAARNRDALAGLGL